MGMLESIADYLISEELAVAKGTDIFEEFLPETPDTIIALIEYPGRPPDFECEVVERNFQVLTRSLNASDARAKNWDIYKELHQNKNKGDKKYLTTTRWGLIHAQDTPFKLKEDKNSRVVYCCNYSITTQTD